MSSTSNSASFVDDDDAQNGPYLSFCPLQTSDINIVQATSSTTTAPSSSGWPSCVCYRRRHHDNPRTDRRPSAAGQARFLS